MSSPQHLAGNRTADPPHCCPEHRTELGDFFFSGTGVKLCTLSSPATIFKHGMYRIHFMRIRIRHFRKFDSGSASRARNAALTNTTYKNVFNFLFHFKSFYTRKCVKKFFVDVYWTFFEDSSVLFEHQDPDSEAANLPYALVRYRQKYCTKIKSVNSEYK
jgi:hypothetical protein